MYNELDDLMFKYRADKSSRIKHNYCNTYYELFKDRRESVKKVLEIGTAEGASLFAWRDFFPNAMIYGAEIEDKRVSMLQGLDRINVFKSDQTRIKDLARITEQVDNYDLVVDDGSHHTSDQYLTCISIVPHLKEGFIYVIEDVHEPEELENLINMAFEFRWNVSIVKCGSRWDDNLIIVRNYYE